MIHLYIWFRPPAFRKLKELVCYSSYSHRGSYYTLDEIANFDERGLWQCRSIYFLAIWDAGCDNRSICQPVGGWLLC